MESRNNLFPVFLKLENLNLLLVGGGNVGEEKLEALLKNVPNAPITVVADYIKDEVYQMAAEHPHIKIINRKFRRRDLWGKDIVVLGTDSRALHEKITRITKRRNILTNVADTPELCDFYLCSTVEKGDLKIGISTNGKSPTMAKRMREFLEETLPDNIQDSMENLRSIRDQVKGDFQEKIRVLNEVTSVMKDKDKTR